MRSRISLGLLGVSFVIGIANGAVAAEPNWEEILGPTQSTIPGARAALAEAINIPSFHKTSVPSRINWEPDLRKALGQAKAQNRPVFVTMRCLPCKSCSDFDKDVLGGGTDLDPLLLQFVTVRLTSASDVDLRLLPMEKFQDFDVSWWGWFLSPEGRVYGVFGGRDAGGDGGRTSKKGLMATLKRVLDHHYDPRRGNWDVDGPAPQLTAGKATTPTDLPGFDSWIARHRSRGHVLEKIECIHCHQVQEIMHQGAIEAGFFDKSRDLDVWPLPENVGIVIERDDGLLIKSVKEGTPAAKAGLRSGDVLGAAGGRRLFGQADFRAALHRLPKAGPGSLELVYLRDGQVAHVKLEMADGWRKANNGWRISYSEGMVGGTPGFWANDGARFREKLGLEKNAMAVVPFFPNDAKWRALSPAWVGGLRGSDVITAVNGESPGIAGRQWIVWFRTKFEPGDEVRLTVMNQNGGAKRDVVFRAGK